MACNPVRQATADGVCVTHLLDVWNLGRKPLRDLRDDLLDQRLVLHRLTSLHDTIPVVSGQ
jgi:hypothetical protein